jgi:hypothetical protein
VIAGTVLDRVAKDADRSVVAPDEEPAKAIDNHALGAELRQRKRTEECAAGGVDVKPLVCDLPPARTMVHRFVEGVVIFGPLRPRTERTGKYVVIDSNTTAANLSCIATR